ncbi:MAG: hypothetical protein H7256_00535 [Bdellovibrio sp.]|nr:hypothetical protein [Bdellovibrio sp.]
MDIIKTFPDYSHYDIDLEAKTLNGYLKKSQLTVDPELFKNVEKGDIIELYSFPENVQLFSNTEFRRLCSYSNEQMNTIPFPKLFWRDDEVHLFLMKKASIVCDGENKICRWDFKSHELVEALHPKKRTFMMNLKWIAPCYREGSDKAVAFISTCQVEFIYELPE